MGKSTPETRGALRKFRVLGLSPAQAEEKTPIRR